MSDQATPVAVGRLGWLERARNGVLAFRDRLLGDPAFQRRAAASPFMRPVARKRARELYDIVAGFVYSQTLSAAVRLELFDLLAAGPMSLRSLARETAMPPEALRRLLVAAESLRLVDRRGVAPDGDALYGLGDLGAAVNGAPGVKEMVAHHALLYADLADPVSLLRASADPARSDARPDTRLSGYWRYAGDERAAALPAEAVADYTRLMGASQPLVAEEVLAAHPFRRARRLLDIGGGDGSFARAALAAAPGLEAVVFDLPAVAERATARFAAEGLSARATAIGGSFFDDPLPTGCDLLTLVRVIFDHGDAAAVRILRAARAATPPDGALLVAEPMADTPGAEPIGAAYYNFYLLAMGGGRARSPEQLSELLRAAGYGRVRLLSARRPILTRVLVARP